MTNQEFFTKSVTHVLAQTSRSVGPPTGSCVYASPDGNACAVGCVLPLELALKAGNSDVYNLLRGFPEAEVLGDVDLSLLRRCQNIHDEEHLRDKGAKARLRTLFAETAEEFGLVMP